MLLVTGTTPAGVMVDVDAVADGGLGDNISVLALRPLDAGITNVASSCVDSKSISWVDATILEAYI